MSLARCVAVDPRVGIAADGNGNVYVADEGPNVIYRFCTGVVPTPVTTTTSTTTGAVSPAVETTPAFTG